MNNYPILAAQGTWFAPTVSTVTRSMITEIEIMDSYTPDSSVTIVDSWDASAAKNGSIICYVIGTKLIMAGNGSGKIALNASAKYTFYDNINWSDEYSNVTAIIGAQILDFSNVVEAHCFFLNCHKLVSVNVTNWDLSNVETVYSMFDGCNSLKSVDLSQWRINKPITFSQMFYECNSLTSVGDLSNLTLDQLRNAFFNCENLVEIKLGVIESDAANVFSAAFYGCKNLEYFSIKKTLLNTNISLNSMFSNCSKLKYCDISNIDFSKVTDMSFMFFGCSSLKEIDVSNWDVSNVTNIDHFAAHAYLKRKGMEKWNTKSLINANAAFHNCAEEELDLSGWDVSKVQFFSQMFENSPNLKHIKGLDKWDTSNVIGFDEMFERCPKLEELDLSNWDTSKAKNGVEASTNGHITATFRNFCNDCQNLKWIKLGPNFAVNGDGTNTNAEYKLILPTPSTDYIEGADGNWYTFTGQDYTPNTIPDRTYNTYYASKNLIRDLSVQVNNGTILDIVEAVREKVPNLEPTLLSDLDDIIRNI